MSDAPRPRPARIGAESGQTTSEYLVMMGILALLTVAMVNVLYGPVRTAMAQIAQGALGSIVGPP